MQEEEAEPVKFKDFFLLFKENKPMVVYYLKGIFSGFIWSLIFCHACVLHKMGILHGSDHRRHKHGAVWCPQRHFFHDDAHTALVGAVIGRPLLKLFKNNPIKMTCFLLVVQSVGGVVLFITQMAGLFCECSCAVLRYPVHHGSGGWELTLSRNPWWKWRLWTTTFIKPARIVSALTMVVGGFIVKAQAALSAAIIGAVLMSIGYNVDPITSEYMGELSQIPTMLNWFIVIMGLVPAILGVLSALILRTYPIKDDERRKNPGMPGSPQCRVRIIPPQYGGGIPMG